MRGVLGLASSCQAGTSIEIPRHRPLARSTQGGHTALVPAAGRLKAELRMCLRKPWQSTARCRLPPLVGADDARLPRQAPVPVPVLVLVLVLLLVAVSVAVSVTVRVLVRVLVPVPVPVSVLVLVSMIVPIAVLVSVAVAVPLAVIVSVTVVVPVIV